MPSPAAALTPALRARYGLLPVPLWKRGIAALAALLVVGAVLLLGWTAANPAVTASLLTYRVVSPEQVLIIFEVTRPAEQAVTCVLRAQDIDHHDVGYATITIPPGPALVRGEYSLATRTNAVVGEVLGCSAEGPPRVPAPQFPPGTANPPQLDTLAGS